MLFNAFPMLGGHDKAKPGFFARLCLQSNQPRYGRYFWQRGSSGFFLQSGGVWVCDGVSAVGPDEVPAAANALPAAIITNSTGAIYLRASFIV
jgi:hypothetical protein